MNNIIWTSDRLNLDKEVTAKFMEFLQQMANRRGFGAARYGDVPKVEQKFMTRLKAELKAYQKEGNKEQLLNIAVYAFLESYAPENKRYHFDATRKFVT